MMYRERWIGALAMGLLWAVATGISYYILCDKLNTFGLWMMLFSSLLMVVFGLTVYLGGIMVLAGFNTMTEQERSQYNIEEVTSFVGILLVLLSYISLLMLVYFVFIGVFLAIVIFMAIYVSVGKRFRAST